MSTALTQYKRTHYRTRRKDGTQYTATATATGYTMGGVEFATLKAALTAARTAHEQAQHSAADYSARGPLTLCTEDHAEAEAIARKAAQHDLQI